MPRAPALNEFDRERVKALREEGLSFRAIAARIGRSQKVVSNCLRLGALYATKKRSGRPSALSVAEKHGIIQLATQSKLTSSEIKSTLNLGVTSRRIRQFLTTRGVGSSMQSTEGPQLLTRLEFAKKYASWDDEWSKVVFSGEDTFHLDGSGKVTTWAAISRTGKTAVCFISERMDTQAYCQLLEDILIPFAEEVMDRNMIFQQQDSAACYAAGETTKRFLTDHRIPTLDWPACSPDLNPLENVWILLRERVFKHGRKFEAIDQLKTAIMEEWDKLDRSMLEAFVDSMPGRLHEVIMEEGDCDQRKKATDDSALG